MFYAWHSGIDILTRCMGEIFDEWPPDLTKGEDYWCRMRVKQFGFGHHIAYPDVHPYINTQREYLVIRRSGTGEILYIIGECGS